MRTTGGTSRRVRLCGMSAVWVTLICVLGMPLSPVARAEEAAEPAEPEVEDNPWMDLGVKKPLIDVERNLIKDQIRSFIPPLLRGSTPMHAFVLPPRTFEVSVAPRFAEINGDDFFRDGEENVNIFGNFRTERNFTDLSLFYGFDFKRKYLHSFTAFLNVPYVSSRTDGAISPDGIELIDIMNRGSTQELGDISLIIKKKVVDQANFPVGLAVAAGVFFPTGSNSERFGEDGVVSVNAPDMAALMGALPGLGCSSPIDCPIPQSMLQMMGQTFQRFPFNNGVFDRFSDDGRLPAGLQPGDGDFSFVVGGFLTRQFLPGDLPLLKRAALHLGSMHRFRRSEDGIDPGDINTHQLTFVVPVWKDYLAIEVGYLGFYKAADHYDGKFITPLQTDASGNIASSGATHVTFKQVDRPSFAKGEFGNVVTSLIFSADPQTRFVATVLRRVVEPDLGPAPATVLRFSASVLF